MTNVKEIQRAALWVLNKVAEGVIYNCCDEHCATTDRNAFEEFNKSLKMHNLIDWDNLTVEECKALRFGKWMNSEEVDRQLIEVQHKFDRGEIDEAKRDDLVSRFENTRNLMLIPLYLFEQIPEGQQLYYIDGEAFLFNKEEADNDIRYGCLAYGVKAHEGKD